MARTAHVTKEHAQAVARAAEYFSLLAKSGELPITPDDFSARVKEFFDEFEKQKLHCNALTLAVLNDELCPYQLFAPWSGYAQIRRWSKLPADQNPLPTMVLNKKLCVRPSDFFKAFKLHGKATP